jgi:hypothetical protein
MIIMDIRELEWKSVGWIKLAQSIQVEDRRALLSTEILKMSDVSNDQLLNSHSATRRLHGIGR